MKNKFTIVYTIFASIGFLFALSFLGLNLYREYNYSSINAEKKFDNIVGELTYASKDPNLNTKSLLNKLNQTIGSLNDFSYLSISINDVDLIKYPSKANQHETSSRLTKSYDKIIHTEVGNFHITCNLYLIRPSSIFYYGKVAFIIVLLITLLTIIIIIYENISDEKDTSYEEKNIDYKEDLETNNTSLTEAETHVFQENTENTTNPEPVENTQTEEKNNDIVNDSQDLTSTPSEEKTEKVNEEVENAAEEVEKEKVTLPSEEEKPLDLDQPVSPSGLFNPVTGLGWEEYLLTRLDSEINRAIASEIDFSLFVIQLPNLERNSEYVKNVCNYLALQFQFKDLLFEYQDDCLVAMKINMNLDEALNLGDKVYAGIKNIIEDKPCYIGISTRSIRMVSGQRLLKEATEALAHTKDDEDSPIIAFRVDAEKYRQFLEQNSNN